MNRRRGLVLPWLSRASSKLLQCFACSNRCDPSLPCFASAAARFGRPPLHYGRLPSPVNRLCPPRRTTLSHLKIDPPFAFTAGSPACLHQPALSRLRYSLNHSGQTGVPPCNPTVAAFAVELPQIKPPLRLDHLRCTNPNPRAAAAASSRLIMLLWHLRGSRFCVEPPPSEGPCRFTALSGRGALDLDRPVSTCFCGESLHREPTSCHRVRVAASSLFTGLTSCLCSETPPSLCITAARLEPAALPQ